MSVLISRLKVLECIGNAINGIVNMPTTHDKRTETHSCDNERTETHGDLISRKAAINAVCSVCGDTECNIFDPDNKAKLYCPEPYAIMKLPSAEPNESDCWGCNCPKMERLNAEPERKNGKWIYNSPVTMKCNQCGLVIKDWDWHRFKYCPNCGARMDGEQE